MARPARKYKRLSETEIKFAQFITRISTEERLRFYRKLASLLRNRFSLMDGLDRMYMIASKNGKNKNDTFAIAISQWMLALQNGESFSSALRGWAPKSELLMLSVGDIANLDDALENLIEVVEGMKQMKGPIIGAIAYPAFLLIMVVLIIYAVGKWMVPPMLDAVPNTIWRGTAKTLVDLSGFVQNHPVLLFSILPIIFIIVWITMSRWKGSSRRYVENIPPWSLYRILTGVSWLMSLSALVKAGTPVSKALRVLRSDATPYLLYRIDKALVYISGGENLGQALFLTGLRFPDDDIIGDLQVYAELDNFSDALDLLANEWLKDSIRTVEQKAAVLNGFAILLIALVIAWVVFGTFDMQNQMIAGM